MKKGKDGRYHTSVSYNGQKKSVSGRTEAEAIRKAEQLRITMKRGELADERKTVGEYTKAYMETYHASGSKQDETMNAVAKNNILPELGKKKLASITPTDLMGFINSLPYGYWHTSKIVHLLKAIFRQAHEDRLIPFDPARNIKVPRGLQKGAHRNITDQEREMILKTADTHPAGLYVRIILYAGLRPGEAAALRWSDIDLKKQIIHVRRALKRDDTIGPPKSASGVRDVPIPSQLSAALLPARKSGDAPVVEKLTGGPLNNRGKEMLWRSFKRKMELNNGAEVYRNKIISHVVAADLTPYCLRHTYCTDLEAAGVPITVAAYLMGHSEISVTADYYTHTDANVKALDDAAEAINRLHAPKKEQAPETNVVSILDFRAKRQTR